MSRMIILGILSGLFIIIPPVFAGQFDPIDEIIAGNFSGFGARQMGMGGAGMMTLDGTALFYNPANLARIPRIELNLGLSYQKFKDDAVSRPIGITRSFKAHDSKTNSRFNSAIMSVPYPTYRGSLVFGFGMVRSSDFDRVSRLNYVEGDGAAALSNIESSMESGGLNEWAFGFGIDLSPRVSFGGSVLLYSGKHDFTLKSPIYQNGLEIDSYEQLLKKDYFGIGGKIGLAMQLSPHLGMGMAVESPVSLAVDEDGYEIANDLVTPYSTAEYDLKRPFIFSAGLISRFDYATLMADIDYSDWTQFAYSDNFQMEVRNDQFKEYYRETLRLRAGGEYVFPDLGLSLRAGYFYDPLPFSSDYFNKDRKGFSLGLGLLVDEVMTIDMALVHGSYTNYNLLSPTSGSPFVNDFEFIQDISYNRVYLAAAYRF